MQDPRDRRYRLSYPCAAPLVPTRRVPASRARRTAPALLLLRRQVLIHGHVRVALPCRTECPSWKDADFAVAEAAIQRLGGLAATRVQYEQGAATFPGGIMQGSDQRSANTHACLLYTSPSPRDRQKSRMPSSA